MKEFGRRIKELRLKKGLTGEQLANELNRLYNSNVNKSMISLWENGKKEIMKNNIILYANYFGVSMDWLINGESGNYKNNHTTDRTEEKEFYLIEHNGKMIKFYIKELGEKEIREIKESEKPDLAFNDKKIKKDLKLLENVLTEIYLKIKLGKE